MSSTLFERLGGQRAVDNAVDIFYRKVPEVDRVNHFFDDVAFRSYEYLGR